MIIPKELKRLAGKFPSPLFVVGGAVRDSLEGRKIHDYDLTSSLTAEKVVELLMGTEFNVTPHSLKLGTLGIKVGSAVMEYTAFRKDSYSGSGEHSPALVEFNCSQREDALRRDFTVNAIYYDILKGEYVDPLGGIKDVERKLLRATREPRDVIEEDALRMLRLVRFSSALGYAIEKNTYLAVKERAYTLKEIAIERIREEFNKILIADTVNGIEGAHIRGIELLVELGLMEHVVPELLEGIGVRQNPNFHIFDVYKHILETVRVIPPHLRLVALLHDIGKPRSVGEDGKMHDHAPIGAGMTRVIMNRLLYPHRETERAVKLVENHMFNIKCLLGDEIIRVFILKNHDILVDLLELKKADHVGHGKLPGVSPSAIKIKEVYDEMLKNNVAFSIKELPVGGAQLIENKIKPIERAKVLSALLEHGAYIGRALSKEECIDFIKAC